MTTALREINLPGLRRFRKGKVRDTWDLGDQLLMVASDRISAFDVILPDAIPDKGRVLTLLSSYWFEETSSLVPNHVLSTDVDDLPERLGVLGEVLRDRFMIVRKAERLDVECVVRGYLAGSGWAEYRGNGAVCGVPLPDNLVESARLTEPIFTPADKADHGHDENITFAQMENKVGRELAGRLRELSLMIYAHVEKRAAARGIIVADTKLEFGLIDGEVIVIDELVTPDSSRFWDAEAYEPGRPQDSLDKQPLRDWLERSGWNKTPPAPPLPGDVIASLSNRYRTAYERLTELELPQT